MTVSEIPRRALYTGDGSTTQYPFSFRVFADSDIAVYVSSDSSTTATPEQLTLGTDYTVTLEDDGTGTVVLAEALASGYQLAILSEIPQTQEMRLTNQGAFYPTVINDSADKLTALIQQVDEKVSRAVLVESTSPATPEEFVGELLDAKGVAKEYAEQAAASAEISKEVAESVEEYSWDIPHLVDNLEQVEAYEHDGYFWVKGYGDAGTDGEDISNRVVGGETLADKFSTISGDIKQGQADTLAVESAGIVSRMSNGSQCVGEIWVDTETQDWGSGRGLEDAMLDPQEPDTLYITTSSTGRQGTLHRCAWDGEKFVLVASSAQETVSHQGTNIYRTEAMDAPMFFGADKDTHKLVLRSWSGADGDAAVVEREWTVLSSEMSTATSVSREGLSEVVYTALAPAVSPDQKKVCVRMVRTADAKVVFRVWDIAALLASSEDDQTTTYEASVEEPDFSNWSTNLTYDISRQSHCFDGSVIYCLDSHTGNSAHFIKAFDLAGRVVCERPATWEGQDRADLSNCEGESLRLCRDRLGRLTLMLGVSMFADSVRYIYLYGISNGGLGTALPWKQAWSERLGIATDGTLTIKRQRTVNSEIALGFNSWGVDRGGIGLYGNYQSFESTSDVLIRAGKGTDYVTAVRLLANSAYKAFACDGTGESGAISLGRSDRLWSQLYASTSTISTSDERLKANIRDPEEALMRAWGKVGFKVFQFKEAVERKGADARLHIGVVAQQVRDAFASEGLDADRYGLFCHDSWEANPEEGIEAGDRYGIRYEEALALECAYQRWQLNQIKAKLEGNE
jgi:hypothetical protein